ncbi:hypothetical protein H6G81_25330 [Scytonema hofmannii FACHB-248]|uniref:Transposase n=1 Tax=Scytonema hofmannii FACHB-248 TaxID=1842502 RepID=A0ABR8GXG8_9CYAN|nr:MULTISPECIES: hypothetical protein [Nostocales]MBD2607760.1 hypothetical protein [Scytonema hofmannii FACHB-248]
MITIIKQESKEVNHLSRFVTVEAIALLLNIDAGKIREIRLWRYMILVVADGMSRFVSYAEIPPILGAAPPTVKDFLAWRKRWRKLKTNHVPDYWCKFYAKKFGQSNALEELKRWGQLIAIIKFALSQKVIQTLRSLYAEERYCLRFRVCVTHAL